MRFLVFTSDGKTHIVDAHASDVAKHGARLAIWWRMPGYGCTYGRWDLVEWFRWPHGEKSV